MAVWFLAPLAVVGAKIAWDYYNKDDDRASSSNSDTNSSSNSGIAPRYCDVNTILNKCDYPTIEPSHDLASFNKTDLFIGNNLLSGIIKHLQSFHEVSAMKKFQTEEIATSITLHDADCVGYVARRANLEQDMKSLKALNAEMDKLKSDVKKYDRLVDELAGNVFKKFGNLFNSQDAEDAENFREKSVKASQMLSSRQPMLAPLEESIKEKKAVDAASKLFSAVDAQRIHTGLLNEIESIDNAFNSGVKLLGSQLNNLTCISETAEGLQSLFDTLNSTAFKAILNITYIEAEPATRYFNHKLEHYGNIRPLMKLLRSRAKDTHNAELLAVQIESLTVVSERYQARQDDIGNVAAELVVIKQSYQQVNEEMTTPDSEQHDLKSVFDEYNAAVTGKIESFEKILAINKAFKVFDFDQKIAFRNNEMAKLQKNIEHSDKKLDNIQTAIYDLEDKIATNEVEINSGNRTISTLEQYVRDLTSADNSYEKAMIHEKIENDFGEGNPNKLIRTFSKKKEANLRAIDKQKEKIIDIITNMVVPVSDILIDGNNCCYFDGDKLLGLSAIKAIVPQLCPIAKVTVVFDHTILKRVDKTEYDIRQELFFKGVEILIAPKGEIADNFLNMMADKKPDSIIVSNDGFQEFTGDKKRIRNHMITSDMIMVHSLNVSASFS